MECYRIALNRFKMNPFTRPSGAFTRSDAAHLDIGRCQLKHLQFPEQKRRRDLGKLQRQLVSRPGWQLG